MNSDFVNHVNIFPRAIENLSVYGIGVVDNTSKKKITLLKEDLVRFTNYYLDWAQDYLSGNIVDLKSSDIVALEEIRRSFLEIVGRDLNYFEKEIIVNLDKLFEFVELSIEGTVFEGSEKEIEEITNTINIIKYDLGY